MHDVILMAEGNAVQQHSHVTFDVRICQRLMNVANHFGQIAQHVFHDEDVAHAMSKDVQKFDDLHAQRKN